MTATMEKRVLVNLKNGETIETPFSDGEAVATLRGMNSTFALSLLKSLRKYHRLSENQMFWAHKLAIQASEPKRQIALDVAGIAGLFETAKQHLRYPKIGFALPSGTVIKLSVAGAQAKHPGSINVSNGVRYGEPNAKWYGRIYLDGQFEPAPACTPEVEQALQDFAADPAGYAGKYGRLTGGCCFCGKGLTDDRSLEVGYGPVCAEHYGLPWGK